MSPTASRPASRHLLRAIATTALVAGTLDIVAACTQFALTTGKSPVIVLQFVASGVFGKAAFTGGPAMAVWGLLLHFLIATIFTVAYFWLYPRLPWLGRHPVAAGLGYGVVVWLIMNRMVVPLSGVAPQPFIPLKALMAAAILMLCIGLPIALLTARYYNSRR
ncbi:DUF1440 domain-containing protein [Hymenobacter lucidus]|uniref:DUF1440 domain-containing protein n=1 Tax=Hymenobacter lucidus TaxID=2880930 RepID=A0ABS8AQ96_9BACT|nr:DUF1440 domain-containing protein [Hymenobacter lucidus]MCB2407914.1 DUF1440 domain-containing protein [Hymenobacter lucidus]